MRERPSEIFFNGTLSLVGLVLLALILRREFGLANRERLAPQNSKPTYIADWEHLPVDRMTHRGDGLMRIIVFVDYECGFCRLFEETTSTLVKSFPDRISVAVAHFPIRAHRFARLAANLAECSSTAGRFKEAHALLLAKQDSFGLKPWTDLAREAGVNDSVFLNRCIADQAAAERVESDSRLGGILGVTATPTVIVNGWKLPMPPSVEELTSIAKTLQSGAQWQPQGGDTLRVSFERR